MRRLPQPEMRALVSCNECVAARTLSGVVLCGRWSSRRPAGASVAIVAASHCTTDAPPAVSRGTLWARSELFTLQPPSITRRYHQSIPLHFPYT